MSDTRALRVLQVETVTRGGVPEDAMDLAVLRVRAELRAVPEPVRYAKIKLAMAADPPAGQPAVAQASVDLNGRRIRAQAVAETMRAAIELMCKKLKVRLERAAEQAVPVSGAAALAGGGASSEGGALAGEGEPGGGIGWRLPQPRRSAETPSVVRYKSYGLSRLTPDEAIADLEMLDYEFHLFTERATDTDSVVYLTEDGYRIAQADPRPDLLELEPMGSAVTLSQVRAPRLDVAEAQARLEALGRPFMFFVNNRTGRGNLIYHRYDGHYGLITPADR